MFVITMIKYEGGGRNSNGRKKLAIRVCICISIYLSIHPSTYLSIYLSAYIHIYLYICRYPFVSFWHSGARNGQRAADTSTHALYRWCHREPRRAKHPPSTACVDACTVAPRRQPEDCKLLALLAMGNQSPFRATPASLPTPVRAPAAIDENLQPSWRPVIICIATHDHGLVVAI